MSRLINLLKELFKTAKVEKKYKADYIRELLQLELENFEFEEYTCWKTDKLHNLIDLYLDEKIDSVKLKDNVDKLVDIFDVKKNVVNINLTSITSIAHSSSDKIYYKDINEFGKNYVEYYMQKYNISKNDIEQEMRRLFESGCYHKQMQIKKFTWCDKYHYDNNGESHRAAGLIYLLYKNFKTYMIDVNLLEYSLNQEKINKLTNEYHIFITTYNNNKTLAAYLNLMVSHPEQIIDFELRSTNLIMIYMKKEDIIFKLLLEELTSKKESQIIYFNSYIDKYL